MKRFTSKRHNINSTFEIGKQNKYFSIIGVVEVELLCTNCQFFIVLISNIYIYNNS